jgi:hypothetical protein
MVYVASRHLTLFGVAHNNRQENKRLGTRVPQGMTMAFQREKHVPGMSRHFDPIIPEDP